MGKEQKVQISYNGYVGFNRATELPEYVDTWDYARLLNEAEGITRFTNEEIQAMRDGSQPDRWANEHFVDDISREMDSKQGMIFQLMEEMNVTSILLLLVI